jgi:hypothetical protein
MSKRTQLMSLATLTALTLLSSAPRADDENVNVADNGGYRSEPAPQSCTEAQKAAWFYRQLELTDGDTSPDVAKPAECQRDVLANSDDAK